jgi:hypothetical protein
MATFLKVVGVAFLVVTLLVVGSGLLLAAAVVKAGLVMVEVHSSGPDGEVDLVLPLPAALVALGARLAPDLACFDGVRCPIGDWTPAAAVALRELAAAPDAVLVDVRDGGDAVWIAKRGETLEIRVQDGHDGRVEVRLPATLLPQLADAID